MLKSKRKGVTLIELLIVVLILAALAAIAITRITGGAETAKANACKALSERKAGLFYER